MTTEYVPDEDRLRLTAHVRGGGIARVWLTRRIADKLFASLIKAVRPRSPDPAYAELVGEIAQSRAEQLHEPQVPVTSSSPDHDWLVRRIDVRTNGAGTLLVFRGLKGEQAQLGMSPDVVRQWLAIAQRVYGMAEWPIASWHGSAQTGAADRRPPTVLH